MEIKYWFVIIIVVALLAIVWLWHSPTKSSKITTNTKKIANTLLIRKSKVYQDLVRKYRMMAYGILIALSLCVVVVAALSARLIMAKTIDNRKYNRDIMLCMDVSTSMNMVNQKIVDTYSSIIDSMKGERFGLSIFNGKSLLRVPLTDDYDFVQEEFGEMRHIYDLIGYSEEIDRSKLTDEEYREVESYLFSGTLSYDGVSSATGNGLASCIYDFPDLNEERSRIIILSSDNEVYGEQRIDVGGAAKIAANKGIKVYALAPSAGASDSYGGIEVSRKARNELSVAVASTDGELYLVDDGNAVGNVINEIEQTEKTLLDGSEKTVEVDVPEVLFVFAMLMFLTMAIMVRMIK